jgi:transcriptional regulator with XRE-family HTH domain
MSIRPDPLDELVGRNIRLCRMSRRIGRAELAARIGASVAEIECFESGTHRVGAPRLMRIAQALDLEVSVFFACTTELDSRLRNSGSARRRGGATVH